MKAVITKSEIAALDKALDILEELAARASEKYRRSGEQVDADNASAFRYSKGALYDALDSTGLLDRNGDVIKL